MVIPFITRGFRKIFGSRNERQIKAYRRRAEHVNTLESAMRRLTDSQLRDKTREFRERVRKGERMSQVQPEALAVAREVMDRAVGIRSVFNPARAFDPATLPAPARAAYERTAALIAQTPPAEVPGCTEPTPSWMLVEIPLEIYEAVRALHPHSRPPFRCRPFDVQLIGGMVLSEGRIAEMRTGEGKTIVAPLACYLASVEGLHCCVVTVNDYLVQRDRDWVFPFHHWLGLTVGAIHPFHMQHPSLKARAYACDLVYGTNSEFGFDYLRDNMKLSLAEQVQKRRDFCIIDEVDSILIDEARTPLIISGAAHDDAPRYGLADQLARHLMQKQRAWDAVDERLQASVRRAKGLEGDIRNAREKDRIPPLREELKRLLETEIPRLEAERDQHTQYYEIELEKKAAHLTHQGIAEAQRVADLGSFYVGANIDLPHLLENSLRAHAVYRRDKDYVVDGGDIVIVDEFTGRKMIGRQWSDGLHQAIEAKERVKIKEETQTLATVTIQNYFKLFSRLAGMTGTAATEASEFNEVYKLDVVSIPTNLPVIRQDRDDLIFMSEKDKWDAILDEIKAIHDTGRPVLVGTTSVERSEYLSGLLTQRHAIKHEVLNAKQHEREAHIVESAGALGAVMIATNMAGRGTDIKLQPIERAALIRHWQLRGMLPSEAEASMPDDRILELAHRQLAQRLLQLPRKDASETPYPELRLRLLRHWVATQTFTDPTKAQALTEAECLKLLDAAPNFTLHRLAVYAHVQEMGGLHIIGTERHESRRIDNQLRGRAGRQGDRGSSRFFISLEDPLMQMFAGKVTINALSRLGMKEGDAIEHPWITKSVERAQRKVEERNFEVRKSLLEYDEVMEHQRRFFYGTRQEVLEGRAIRELIFDYLGDAVSDAVDLYLDRDYVPGQIAEWVAQNTGAAVEPFKLRLGGYDELAQVIREEALTDLRHTVDTTLGEYMNDDVPPEEWNVRELSQWAQSAYGLDLKPGQIRKMNPDEVRQALMEGGQRAVDRRDLRDLAKFLEPLYPQRQLAAWAKTKFELELSPERLASFAEREQVREHILAQARDAYRQREVRYPVEYHIELAFQAAKQDGQWAADHLCRFARERYGLEWTTEGVRAMTGQDIFETLHKAGRALLREGGLEREIDEAMRRHPEPAALAAWAEARFGRRPADEKLAAPESRKATLEALGREALRTEVGDLERFVLLQVLDQAWKDHLYAMDQLKDAIGLRGYAERDPRIEYKREGTNLLRHMQASVRDKVTDLIFRARLTANVEMRNVYAEQEAQHAQADSALNAPSASESDDGQDAGEGQDSREGVRPEDDAQLSRKQRRAAQARERRDGKSQGQRNRRRR